MLPAEARPIADRYTFGLGIPCFRRKADCRRSSDSDRGNAGKIKEKLQPALEELEAVGFLAPMSKDERYRKTGKRWEIRITGLLPPTAPAIAAAEATQPSGLAAELMAREVTARIAAELVEQHPADAIALKLEIFDWLMEQKEKRLAKNPAGWLVKSIRDNDAPPQQFRSKAERPLWAEARRKKDEEAAAQRRHHRDREAGEPAERKALTADWEALTPEQQAAHDRDAIAQARAEDLKLIEVGPMKRYGLGMIRAGSTRKLLQAQGKLPLPDAEAAPWGSLRNVP